MHFAIKVSVTWFTFEYSHCILMSNFDMLTTLTIKRYLSWVGSLMIYQKIRSGKGSSTSYALKWLFTKMHRNLMSSQSIWSFESLNTNHTSRFLESNWTSNTSIFKTPSFCESTYALCNPSECNIVQVWILSFFCDVQFWQLLHSKGTSPEWVPWWFTLLNGFLDGLSKDQKW